MEKASAEITSQHYGHQSFRDALTTVDEDGKRKWVYAKQPKGKWYRRRSWFGYALLAWLFMAPFLKMNGHQMILLNFIERKFVFFGSVFWPSDFFIFLVGIISVLVFIFLFTAVFGRLWCGWACPQTIFMELVFRRIEYWIEGQPTDQKRLDKLPWNGEKILKRGGKFAVFYIVSFIIANVFMAYLTGSDSVMSYLNKPLENVGTLSGVIIFTTVFFFVYSYMREQICTIVCPYGRLQSVLIDDKSLTVAYNYKRGEPREKWGRKRASTAGDCISCMQCVDVCPTGIDIRNGSQMECINCTACVDACNLVMLKLGKPKGLIAFESMSGIETGEKFRMNTRRKLYSVLLGMLLIGFALLLSTRTDVSATVLRTPGLSYSVTSDGTVRNIFNIKVLNKTFKELPVDLKAESFDGTVTPIGNGIIAPSQGLADGIISIEINEKHLTLHKTPIQIGLYAEGKKLQTITTNFFGPGI